MNYYDHASLQAHKIGPWADPVSKSHYSDKPRAEIADMRSGARIGSWAGVFALVCWFI